MADTGLAQAIESARKRLGLSKMAYARRVGISRQALYGILDSGWASRETLMRLREKGGVKGLEIVREEPNGIEVQDLLRASRKAKRR